MKFHHHWAATALFIVASSVSTISHAAPVSGQGTWETTLQGRDLDGNLSTFEAYYDTAANITWLADANLAGLMSWTAANVWATGLNINGITGWRLPTMIDTGTPGCLSLAFSGTDCGSNVQTISGTMVYSEMASMFYDTLGNLAFYDTSGVGPQPGYGLTNTGPFSNIQPNYYRSGLEYAPDPSFVWIFTFNSGIQNIESKSAYLSLDVLRYAWAVHPGDVGASTVPVPAAVWLFGSGLLGLIGIARRKTRRMMITK